MKKKVFCAIVGFGIMMTSGIGAAAPANSNANDAGNDSVEVRFFNPDLNLKASTSSINYGGGSVNFKDDLGMSSSGTPEIRAKFGNIRVDYMKISDSGSKAINQNLSYQGTTYNAGTTISSNLDITYARAAWIRPITHSPKIETNWLVDIKGFKFDTAVQGSVAGVSTKTSKSFTGAIPTIGFNVTAHPDAAGKFEVFAELSGLPLGKYGDFYDVEAGVKYKPSKDMQVDVGYRAVSLNAKNPSNSDHAEFKFAGPYAGLNIYF